MRSLVVTIAFFMVSTEALHILNHKGTIVKDGYDVKQLPEAGGWTGWFSSDGPGGTGDHETTEHIIGRYGQGCSGIPCSTDDIIVTEARTTSHSWKHNRYSPQETGNTLSFTQNGLLCLNAEQTDGSTCRDYQVRFYCSTCDHDCCMPDMYNKKRHLLALISRAIRHNNH